MVRRLVEGAGRPVYYLDLGPREPPPPHLERVAHLGVAALHGLLSPEARFRWFWASAGA